MGTRPRLDVIVIGAGVAGLEAASRLQRAGLDVAVVEARPRVGGRIETHHLNGWPGPVEAGAEFVHGRPPALLTRLRASGARLVEVRPRHVWAQDGHVRSAGSAWRAAQAWMEHLPDEDVPFDEVLARDARRLAPAARKLVRGFVEGFNAADATRVSTRGLRRQTEASAAEDGERMFRVRDGYDVLPERLARPLAARGRMHLGTVVTAVRLRQGGVEVRARGPLGGPERVMTARTALVTLPLGVLQSGTVRFTPALPRAKRDAIARLAMGRVVKVVVRFRGPLGEGPLAGLAAKTEFLHLPRATVPTWWVPVPSPPRCLVGWVAGPAAERFAAAHAEPERAAAAVSALARALRVPPTQLLGFVEDARVFDWGLDPWARGAYSWVPAGAVGAPAALAAPVGERLFFAGEATDTGGDPGTVHGALATGARAAAEIAERLT